MLEVRRAPGEYSEIVDGNIEEICISDYHQHYLCVREFVEASPSADSRKAAMALRTLVEGHLHRRFPYHLKPGVMLGSLITEIEQAAQQSPMVVLKPYVREFRAFNGFASKYHHDTNPSPESEPISDAELLVYCMQGLQLIHTGAF
jgi:wobble nucleotide-excising tRNase